MFKQLEGASKPQLRFIITWIGLVFCRLGIISFWFFYIVRVWKWNPLESLSHLILTGIILFNNIGCTTILWPMSILHNMLQWVVQILQFLR